MILVVVLLGLLTSPRYFVVQFITGEAPKYPEPFLHGLMRDYITYAYIIIQTEE